MNRLNYALVSLCFLWNISAPVLAATACYQCSTATKPECADLTDTTSIDTCKTTTGEEINCLMYQYTLNGRNITYRGCRNKLDTCEDVRVAIETEGKIFQDCHLCGTDLCKSGVTLTKLAIVPVVMTLPFILRLIN